MNGYALSRAAQADLDGIWDYTEQTWSAEQAERYTAMIRDTCVALATGRKTGKPAERFKVGYLMQSVGSHFIFYTVTAYGVIQVIRILRQRMEIASHLRKP